MDAMTKFIRREIYGLCYLIPAFLFLNRFLLPDQTNDTLNYHLFNGYRGFYHLFWIFSDREFFPVLPALSSFYDVMQYLFYEGLGYRLGTILSLFAYEGILLIAFAISKQMGSDFKERHPILFALTFFNIAMIGILLFEVAGYLADILHTLFQTAGLYFFLRFCKSLETKGEISSNHYYDLGIAGFFFGLALFGKWTGYFAAVSFYVWGLWVLIFSHKFTRMTLTKRILLIGILTALLFGPALVFYGYPSWKLTGNPFFPFCNGIFKSVYYPAQNFAVHHIGGRNLMEKVVWPLVSLGFPDRFERPFLWMLGSKFHLYWVLGILTFIFHFRRLSFSRRMLLLFYLTGTLLWSLQVGTLRYYTFFELTGGLAVLVFLNNLFGRKPPEPAGRGLVEGSRKIILLLLLFSLSIQTGRSLIYNFKNDYSGRPSFFLNPGLHLRQLPHLFEKKMKYHPEIEEALRSADVVINCRNSSLGLSFLSGLRDKPHLLVSRCGRFADIQQNARYREKARDRLIQSENASRGKFRFISVIKEPRPRGEEPDTCVQGIESWGGKVERTWIVRDFLGYTRHRFIVRFGEIKVK